MEFSNRNSVVDIHFICTHEVFAGREWGSELKPFMSSTFYLYLYSLFLIYKKVKTVTAALIKTFFTLRVIFLNLLATGKIHRLELLLF